MMALMSFVPSAQGFAEESVSSASQFIFVTLGQKSVLVFLALTSQIFVCFVVFL